MPYQKNAGAVRRFAGAMKFGAWLFALPGRLTPPPIRLLQIGSAFWQSRALVLDRPQVVAEAERHWPAQGDQDIYLLSAVLHGFDDDACVRILGNLATAVAGTGARGGLELEEMLGLRSFGSILVLRGRRQ